MRVRPLVLASTVLPPLVLALLLQGCGSGGSTGPGGPPDGEQPVFPLAPNPVNVIVTLQSPRAASARVTTAGGTVTATADDGTVYALTLPQDALLTDTTVTITPITTVAGLDLTGGRYIGVQLEPNGLQLFQPATLRMEPPEGADVGVIAFTAHNGQNVHRSPVSVDPTRLEMQLLHFSTGFGHINQGDAGPGPVSDPMPADPVAQLQTVLEKLSRTERERQRAGQEPDPEYFDKVDIVLGIFWNEVVQNIVTRMQADCQVFKDEGHVPLVWSRWVALYGLDSKFAGMLSLVQAAQITALENCWTEITEPCLEPENFGAATSYSRQLALLGVGGHDPRDPALSCGGGAWQGTVTATGPNFLGPSETFTTEVAFELDSESNNGGILFQSWRVRTGTVAWHFEAGPSKTTGCPLSAPDETFTLQPTDGSLTIVSDGQTTRYSAIGALVGPLVEITQSCPEGPPQTISTGLEAWLSTGGQQQVLTTPGVISGTYTDPVNNHTYQWNFTQGGQAVVAR